MGAGSFRCTRCGYIVTLEGSERLPECPSCGAEAFVRASMFSTERIPPASEPTSTGATVDGGARPRARGRGWPRPVSRSTAGRLRRLRRGSGELRVVPLTREWTRVGRSLAADVRFDDPTVSRRHALIVRQPDGVRLLDDRSLNGVFVNGTQGRRADAQRRRRDRRRALSPAVPVDPRDRSRGTRARRQHRTPALHSVG